VARDTQRERLPEAHAGMTDSANAKSISAVAEELWFADASSRTFKREFGYSPTEVRLPHWPGRALPRCRDAAHRWIERISARTSASSGPREGACKPERGIVRMAVFAVFLFFH
jgi:AraC-like DNA-binding protein